MLNDCGRIEQCVSRDPSPIVCAQDSGKSCKDTVVSMSVRLVVNMEARTS